MIFDGASMVHTSPVRKIVNKMVNSGVSMQDKHPNILFNKELFATNIYDNNNKSKYLEDRHFIKEFYEGATVLVTGGTGFLGKILIEKLLRCCDSLNCIYILLRSKKGLSVEERYKNLLENPVFNRIRATKPKQLSKLIFISGDISLPKIGLNAKDRQKLIDTVNIVFHSAATVRFDQNIKDAINLNTLGTQRICNLCCEMTNLKSVVHVSTAYSNPMRHNVEEIVYSPKLNIDIESFLSCTNLLSNDVVHSSAIQYQGLHPNTYTITKSMAEQLVADYHHKLPICIVRPSIVTAAVNEPYPGWIDNINGITGIMMEIGRGTISSIMGDKDLIVDLIPVDVACNLIISAAWLNYYKPSNSITIYNCTSGQINPIRWQEFGIKTLKYARENPTKYVMLYPNFSYRKNRCIHKLYEIFLHFLPAILFDVFMRIQGLKPIMFNIARRYKSAADTGEFFAMNEWNFDITNVRQLIKEVDSAKDGDKFNCDMSTMSWDEYIKNYMFGIRKYVLKDDMDSMENARKVLRRLFVTKWIVRIFFIISIFWTLFKYIF